MTVFLLAAALAAFALLAVWLALEPGRASLPSAFRSLRFPPALAAWFDSRGMGRTGLWEGMRSQRSFSASRRLRLPHRLQLALMPIAAGGATAMATRPHAEGPGSTPATAQQRQIPFHQATHKAEEPAQTFEVTPGTGSTTFGPNPLPAQGYLDKVVIDIEATGGNEEEAVVGLDYPFTVLTLVRLQDSNSATITELTGFQLMLAMTYGGFAGCPDPRNWPQYSANKGNPKVVFKIPVGLNPMGLGVLANQSSSSAFKLTIVVGSKEEIWQTHVPKAIPKLIIRTSTELMTLPPAQDSLGRPQQQVPPYNGTAQYFRVQPNVSLNKGNTQTRVTDTGNMLRMLGFITRVSGARSEEPFPDPYNLIWDTGYLKISTRRLLQIQMRELIEQLAERDKGVYFFNWSYGTHRHAGENELNALIPTVTATRLELTGSSAEAGTVDVFTNTVSIAEINPALRPVQRNATGYAPPTPPANPAGQ